MEYFKMLPVDITLDILTRMPTDSVFDCKLVCTNWRNLVRHPSFSKMHLDHLNRPSADDDSGKLLGFLAFTRDDKFYYFEYENHEESTATPIHRIRRLNFTSPFGCFKVIGSYNGLVCLARGGLYVCICNPITRDYVMLPELKTHYCDVEQYWYVYGSCSFGYVSSTNEYKVVQMYASKSRTSIEVHIYTLGSGRGWRNLGKFNSQFEPYNGGSFSGIFANGGLYWMSRKLEMITAFDLAEEKFCEHLSPPPLPPGVRWRHCDIGVLDGFLCFAIFMDVEGDRFKDIWLLKKKKNNHDKKEGEKHQSLGWSREFKVNDSELLAITKSDGVLTHDYDYLTVYNTKTSTSKRLVKFAKGGLLHVSPHKNTFVSLKELGQEDTNTIESVQIEETRSRDYPFEQLQEDENPEYIYL